MRGVPDEQILKFFHNHLHPMLVHLYLEARIEAPMDFTAQFPVARTKNRIGGK